MPSNIGQIILCSIIGSMLAYIVYEKQGDKRDLLCSILYQSIDKSNKIMETDHELFVKYIKATANCYRSKETEKYAQILDTLQRMKDDVFQILADQNQDLALLIQTCSTYQAETKYYMNYGELSTNALNELALNDSISQASLLLWPKSPEHRRLIISLIQSNLLKNSNFTSNYFASKVGGRDDFNTYKPVVCIEKLNFTAPEKNYLEGDIVLGWSKAYGLENGNNYRLFIDGTPFTLNPFAETIFRKTYAQPGTYPIHLRMEVFDCMADSVFVSEKIYYINVQ